jgi:hypothetical protein
LSGIRQPQARIDPMVVSFAGKHAAEYSGLAMGYKEWLLFVQKEERQEPRSMT